MDYLGSIWAKHDAARRAAQDEEVNFEEDNRKRPAMDITQDEYGEEGFVGIGMGGQGFDIAGDSDEDSQPQR